MKNLIFSILFLSSMSSSNMLDLGTIGSTYEIQEIDLLKQLQEGLKDINTSKQIQALAKSIHQAKTVSSSLPSCLSTRFYTVANEVEAQTSTINLDGSYHIKKGDKIPINNRTAQSVCIIDASTKKKAEKSARLLFKYSCNKILVSGMNFEAFKKKYAVNKDVYPFQKQLSDALHIQCLPTRVYAKGKELEIQEFTIIEDEK